MSWQGFAAWVVISCSVMAGCGLISDHWPRRPRDHGIAPTVGQLVGELAESIDSGADQPSIAVLGFRDGDGEQSAETRLLDEHLIRALTNNRSPVAPGVGAMDETVSEVSWDSDSMLPEDWQELAPERLLSGRLHYDTPWVYVRLILTEKQSGAVLDSRVARLTERELARAAAEAEESEAAEEDTDTVFAVNVDLHLILWRVTASFTDMLSLEEGATVAVGDHLQLRYTTDADCAVWAFLFRSDGVRHALIDSSPIYAGHDQIVSTFTFEAENIVHTLYFVIAEELEADRAELFEEIDEMMRQGEIERFRGLDLVDEQLAGFLSTEIGGGLPVDVIRGGEGIELGAEEKFLEGETSLVSKPERLSGSPVLLRAISFDVQVQ